MRHRAWSNQSNLKVVCSAQLQMLCRTWLLHQKDGMNCVVYECLVVHLLQLLCSKFIASQK